MRKGCPLRGWGGRRQQCASTVPSHSQAPGPPLQNEGVAASFILSRIQLYSQRCPHLRQASRASLILTWNQSWVADTFQKGGQSRIFYWFPPCPDLQDNIPVNSHTFAERLSLANGPFLTKNARITQFPWWGQEYTLWCDPTLPCLTLTSWLCRKSENAMWEERPEIPTETETDRDRGLGMRLAWYMNSAWKIFTKVPLSQPVFGRAIPDALRFSWCRLRTVRDPVWFYLFPHTQSHHGPLKREVTNGHVSVIFQPCWLG